MEGFLPLYGGFSRALGSCVPSRVGPDSWVTLQEASEGTWEGVDMPFCESPLCQSSGAKHWKTFRPLTGVLPQRHVTEVPGQLPGSTQAGLEVEKVGLEAEEGNAFLGMLRVDALCRPQS